MELAMPCIGVDNPVASDRDQVELKSKGSSCADGGSVQSRIGDPNMSAGESNMFVGEMDLLCKTATSECGDEVDQAWLEMVSHDASDIWGEPRRLTTLVLVVGDAE